MGCTITPGKYAQLGSDRMKFPELSRIPSRVCRHKIADAADDRVAETAFQHQKIA